jgi:hypothetical protein
MYKSAGFLFLLFILFPGPVAFGQAVGQLPAPADLAIQATGETTPGITVTLEQPGQPTPTITYNFSREDFNNPLVEIRTTMGSMILELFPKEAPQTVANFISLAEGSKAWTDPATGLEVMRPFYDGTVFHR